MPDRIRVACVQMTSRQDKAANLERAEALVARAASTGADLIVLPEKWNLIGSADDYRAAAEPLEGGISTGAMSRWARTLGVTLVGGSITERREGREKLSNTSCVFGPDGELVAVYRKIHLFDVEVGGHVYRESEAEEPGTEAVVARAEDWLVGLTVCYDVRFPELYRILALDGAELVTVPAHFTTPTGKDHWHVLLRARAIENQYYVAAAGQVGETIRGKPAYGRSLIVDPWGIVLAQAPDEETVIVAELDRARMRDIRAKLPSLANRQPDTYR
jgi:predicted amidohydrolase